jgi:PAS domain S-box-containing protein
MPVRPSPRFGNASGAVSRFRVSAPPRLGIAAGLALAVVTTACAYGIQASARTLFEVTPFLLLGVGPPVVAWAAGAVPALASVALTGVAGWLYLSSSGSPEHAARAVVASLTFLPVGLVLAGLGALVRMGFQEREATARALEESERSWRTLFDLAPFGVALVGRDGRMAAFNAAAHQELGYTREEFERLTLADVEAEEDREELLRHIEKIQATGGDDFLGHHRTRSGEVREKWIMVRTVRIGDEVYNLSIWRDETEERRAQRELARSERRFRALIEKATDMVILLDAQGRIRFWSPSSAERLGWAAGDVLGRDLREFVHADDLAAFDADLGRLAASPGDSWKGSARLRHRDGGWRLLESSGRNLLHDPAIEGVVVNSRDVTDERRLEEALAESQKLESIGRLAGGVAHDFNNLLTVVLCSTETMREDLAAGRPVDGEDVESVQAAGERARDLTRQLLSFARRQVVAPAVLDLNEVIAGAERLLARVLGEDVAFTTRLDPGLWRVRADAAQLNQVLLNLAVNARDAMPEGGHLLVETANVEVRGVPPHPAMVEGEWVRLTVRDSGAGMSPEVKAHLFEPFFTTKPNGQGTGLGLATAYGIVRQAGGHIRVESDPSAGTTFDIFLPRSVLAPASVRPPGARAVAPMSGTVLLVEDDAGVREVAARALRTGGYRVLAAGGASEAMELAARAPGPVDILVTDVVMPGVNGRTLADELRRRRPGMRVLFVSGYADDIIGRHGVLDAGVEFLPKPFTPAALLERVGAVLRGG